MYSNIPYELCISIQTDGTLQCLPPTHMAAQCVRQHSLCSFNEQSVCPYMVYGHHPRINHWLNVALKNKKIFWKKRFHVLYVYFLIHPCQTPSIYLNVYIVTKIQSYVYICLYTILVSTMIA